ncbi:unnamed protein product [Symbiodinium microadriaticum]|nr:unnamed protein product [Symbiodinium microadriaticum]
MVILYSSSEWLEVLFRYAGTVWPHIWGKWLASSLYSIAAYLFALETGLQFGTEHHSMLLPLSVTFLLIFRANEAYARYWLGRSTLSNYISEVREVLLLSIIYVRGGLESSIHLFHQGPGVTVPASVKPDHYDEKARNYRVDVARLSVALAVAFKLHTSIALDGYCFGSLDKEAKWFLDWDRLRLLQLLTEEEFEIVNRCIGLAEDESVPETRRRLASQFHNARTLEGPPSSWDDEFPVRFDQFVRVPVAIVWFLREVLFRNMNDPFNTQPWGIKDRFVGALVHLLSGILESFETAHMVCTTPIPLPYANLCKTLLCFYMISAPFFVDPSRGWFANTVVPSVISFALLGVDAIATELENPFGDDVNDLDQLEQVHIVEREAMELLRQSGDIRGCSVFGWQEVPDFVSNKCCRSLKTQLVVKDLAQLQVMPLVAEEDVVPAWLLDRKEESRQKAAAWLALSCLNQKVRKWRGLPTITYEEQLWLTQRVSFQVEAMRLDWDWISIFMKMYVFGLLMLLYVTFPILLNIFLSWLSSALQGFDFGLVCLCIVLAGMCCFLLPPVPGVPVYLFAGIIIADKCPLGFEAGAGIAIAVGFLLKLMACAMQQKLIGERLGANLTIRTQVGINTPMIRAIEAVLREPGMSMGKVSILCGGPDWPTSVLAGILHLSLLECELGTLPIVFFVAACSLSGSFYLKQHESELWDRAATFMMSASVFLCMLLQAKPPSQHAPVTPPLQFRSAQIMGAWAIQTQLDQREWEAGAGMISGPSISCLLRPRSVDEALGAERGAGLAGLSLARDVTIALAEVGGRPRLDPGCDPPWSAHTGFGEFEVTDDIDSLEWWVDGESGLVLLPGLVCCCLSIGGWAFYFVMSCWLKRKRAKPFLEMAKRLDTIEVRWKEMRRALAAELSAHGACRDNWEALRHANETAQEMLREARVMATE